jgi:hypothetical protein
LQQTNVVDIFIEAARAMGAGIPMTPRSAGDKEYFPQDWFIDRLRAVSLPYQQQGRNSYPDFWVGTNPTEGFEVKSLAFANGRPARSDYDCNSSIPSGRKQQRDVFLAFFLYTGSGSNPRPVQSLSIAHADLINSDHMVADSHMNPAAHEFGSYGDGFIRNRKMYVFPHPFSLDRGGIGKCRLIAPSTWQLSQSSQVRQVGTITRTANTTEIDSYTVNLKAAGSLSINRTPYRYAANQYVFDVFEV